MEKLNPVHTNSLQAVNASLAPEVRKTDYAQRIRDDLFNIVEEENAFEYATRNDLLLDFEAAEWDSKIKEQMKWLYEQRFRSGEALAIREEILRLGLKGCSYCHNANARTLDHLFPKSTHPRLAVTPRNLVPACRDCNEDRAAGTGTISIDPYSDYWVEDDAWLSAEVINPLEPGELRFFAVPSNAWSSQQTTRLSTFLQTTNFLMKCAIAAAHEMRLRRPHLSRLIAADRGGEAKEFLATQSVDHHARSQNYWGSVAFRTWHASFSSLQF